MKISSPLLTAVAEYVENHICDFHDKRVANLQKLRLSNVLKRKNPYLFKAKNVLTASEIVKGVLEAHISSSEETIFGDWLEGLAKMVCETVYGGRKSGIEGIDLEFDRDGKRYIVTIKSGPNWGNSSQINKMKSSFIKARKILRTSNSNIEVEAINGCCYGRELTPDKGEYLKLCGQAFWKFISGDDNVYTEIIEPLGTKAKERNDEFLEQYAKLFNKFTLEFTQEFCKDDLSIDWEKLVRFNSSIEVTNRKRKSPTII